MNKFVIMLILAIGLFFLIPIATSISENSSVAFAESEPPKVNYHTDILNDTAEKFRKVTKTWGKKIEPYANRIFIFLGGFALIWLCIQQMLKRAEIGEIFVSLAKFVITLGCFKFLLDYAMPLTETIFQTFGKIGGEAAGLTYNSTTGTASFGPSDIIELGLDFFYNIDSNIETGLKRIPINLFLYLIAFIFFVICLIIAIRLLTQILALWCYLYAGIIFLGFGSTQWSSNIVTGYYKGFISACAKYYASLFIIAVMKELLNDMIKTDLAGSDVWGNVIALLQCTSLPIIFLFLMFTVPDMMAGIIKGWGDSGFGRHEVSGTLRPIQNAVTPSAVTRAGLNQRQNQQNAQMMQAATQAAQAAVQAVQQAQAASGRNTNNTGDNLTQAIRQQAQRKQQNSQTQQNSNRNSSYENNRTNSQTQQNSNQISTNENNQQNSQTQENSNENSTNESNQQNSQTQENSNRSRSIFQRSRFRRLSDDQKGASESQMNNNNNESNNENNY
ncbi:MAG: type IV secretion system protein [Ruminobacter sp.]|nr:type IV secretion system protein [Ruminobacter sp.]